MATGEWRGLEVAIKKLDISSKCAKARARLAAMATEATIASNLVHPNVVATYTHGLSTSADAIDHTPSGPGRPSSSTGGAVASGEAKYLMVQVPPATPLSIDRFLPMTRTKLEALRRLSTACFQKQLLLHAELFIQLLHVGMHGVG